MRKAALAWLLLCAAVSSPAQAPASAHQAWYARLGLDRSELTSAQAARIDELAARLEAAPDPDPILQALDRRQLQAEDPGKAAADRNAWFQETSAGSRLTDVGMKAAGRIALSLAAGEDSPAASRPGEDSGLGLAGSRAAAVAGSAQKVNFDGAASAELPDGPLPSSYNGSLRGPSLAADDAGVLAPGRSRVALEYAADNNLLNQSAGGNRLLYKAETHSYTLDYERGIAAPRPLQVGVSAGIYQQDEGYLNGFINGAEHLLADLFGPRMINRYRSGPDAMTGTVEDIDVNGVHSDGNGLYGPRLGDVVVAAKAALLQIPGWQTSERLAATIATGGPFSTASSIGAGVSTQRPLTKATSLFVDARGVVPVSARDGNGLALERRPALDATAGVGRRIGRATLTAQFDYAGSPYAPTGLPAYDNAYTDATFGLSYRLARDTVVKLSGSEDFNTGKIPAGGGPMSPYGPADFGFNVRVEHIFGKKRQPASRPD